MTDTPSPASTTLERTLARVDDQLQHALARLFVLLKIPSISTDPAYAVHCASAADHLVQELADIGFDARKVETKGRPVVLGHAKAARRDVPHVLFYGHYDVQPADPVELWTHAPFEPRLFAAQNGQQQIGARGAADDKGQLMTFLEACRALNDTGGLPCDISIMLEGEEESGSPSLPEFIAANKAELKADIALVCDTDMFDEDTPAIITMLRGMVYEEVTIEAANTDLHSGHYGGAAANPLHILSRMIAGLHDSAGRVTIPDFYEGVSELPDEVRTQWEKLGVTARSFLGEVGLSEPAGEKGRQVLELVWARPTAEVNGIVGGYTGAGAKTVLPAKATAKISFRLVGKQNPQKIIESFHEFVRARVPADCRVSFQNFGANPAVQLPLESEALTRARRALEAEWGKAPVVIGAGGSIPVVGNFKRDLTMDTLLIGFGLADDKIHAPNEKYNLKSFHKGIRSWVRVLVGLGK